MLQNHPISGNHHHVPLAEERDVKLMWVDRAHVWREGCQRFRPQLSKHSQHSFDGENPSVEDPTGPNGTFSILQSYVTHPKYNRILLAHGNRQVPVVTKWMELRIFGMSWQEDLGFGLGLEWSMSTSLDSRVCSATITT